MQKKILGIPILFTLSFISVIFLHFSTILPISGISNSSRGPATTVELITSNRLVNQTVPIAIIHNLTDVVVESKAFHHIISAYYDSRELPNRPSIVLFGYIEWKEADSIFCTVVHEDNTTKCLGEVIQTHLHFHDKKSMMYICRMNSTDKIPIHVLLCERDKCEGCENAKRIPVRNREPTVRKTVGVCVEGPLYISEWVTNEMLFDMVVEFLVMVKVLGVQIVTIYNTSLKHEFLKKILKLFPDFVDIVQWNEQVVHLHYHGQSLLLQDCLYRNMYRVKYLTFIDLDEMIFPVISKNWMDMLQVLEGAEGKYASFKFSNNFFAPGSSTAVSKGSTCPYKKTPKYFVRLQRFPLSDAKERTKVIVKPDLLEAIGIHEIGPYKVVRGYTPMFIVPKSIGMMSHYRINLTQDMIRGKPVEDRTAMKYKDLVIQELERICSL